ncbi:hypothetical protein Ddc_12397 [Ditylenchus destructor]|nr:hypothetical protein Ddc_12397 [Ditylenchus destructor]
MFPGSTESTMLYRSSAVEDLSFVSYFDLLGNDELANVLERLPIQDRMQAELINKRWFNVARGKSWVNFNFLMSKDFEWVRKKLDNTDWTWIDAKSFNQFKTMLKQLLTRCGPYIRNVDVTESSWLSRSLCDVLSMMPNVEQIKLCQLHIKNDRLEGYRRCLSYLRTLIADDFMAGSKDYLSNLLRMCGRMEVLSIESGFNGWTEPIKRFPPLLRCLSLSHATFLSDALWTVAHQRLRLETLAINELHETYGEVVQALMEIDTSQLKYIKLNLKPATFAACFDRLLRWLPPNLRGLSIGLAQMVHAPAGYQPQNVFTVQMLESLCNNRRRLIKLEHLELCNLSLETLANEQNMDTLSHCLAHLRSISLRFGDPAFVSYAMDELCLRISSNPELECLMVNTRLYAISIESLLRNCQV